MKLLYVSSALYPSQLANRIQTLSMARAFHARLGDQFALALPARAELSGEPFRLLPVGGPVKSPLLAWHCLALIRHQQFTHVFCREERVLTFLLVYARLARVRIRVAFEAHELHDDLFFRRVLPRADLVVATTSGLARELAERGVSPRRLIVAPNGVDLSRYDHLPSKQAARRRFGLPEAAYVIGYTGSVQVDGWKGLETLLDTARGAPPDWLFWVVGGKPDVVRRLRAERPGVRFAGYLDPADIPAAQAACDVLVVPNTCRDDVWQPHTSPLKLFEYLASGVPIVASDLPSIRELVSEREVCFFTPDDPAALAAAVQAVRQDPAGAARRASAGRDVARAHTWRQRAEAVLARVTV